MKRILLIAALILTALPLPAQKLVIGERAPELKVERWLSSAPVNGNTAVMVEFFHSANQNSVERLALLSKVAGNNKDKLTVIVLTKESEPAVTALLLEGNPSYYAAYDEGGASFNAFGARYVPYAVIYDKRGRVLWVGNPSSLSDSDIATILK